MRKTWLSVTTALVLVVLSVALMLVRRTVLGAEIDGTPGASAWHVTLDVDGQAAAADASVVVDLPPDFRRQHIAHEVYDSKEFVPRVRRGHDSGARRVVWQRRPGSAGAFHLHTSFRCTLALRRPTPSMTYRTHTADAEPQDGAATRPSPRVESDAAEVTRLASALVEDDRDAEPTARTLFAYVSTLEADAAGPSGALACLRQGRGDAAGRSRLLVALCRNRRLPARLVTGLILAEDVEGERPLHFWVEAWVDGRWLAMDPTHGLFGTRRIPESYFLLSLRDDDLVRAHGASARWRVSVEHLPDLSDPAPTAAPRWMRSVWRRLTLGNLRPEDQEWVQFLLLIPAGALVVCFYRTVIGLATYGTFGPALLGLVCRDLRVLPWAMTTFVALLLVGWMVRRRLDRYHLLLAPRVGALLTVIVVLLVVGVLAAGGLGVPTGSFVALLPLIIMTHMIERFWTIEAEDGTAASFKTLAGTVVVAVTVALLINVDVFVNGAARLLRHGPVLPAGALRVALFRYPEALGLLLAGQLLLGRYTGYRLTELFRFRDLLIEEPGERGRVSAPSKGDAHDGPMGPLPSAEGDGRPRDEPTEHGVHPGPQPARPLPPGGQ